MGLTTAQTVRLVQNQLMVRLLTSGTKPSKIVLGTIAIANQYAGVSATVTVYFSVTGGSPTLGGICLTRTAGFWVMSSIPETFTPTHIRLDTAVGGWSSALGTNHTARLTAWWAKEQEVNHLMLAASAERAETGFWKGDVEEVTIGGTVVEGSASTTAMAIVQRIGDVPISPAPSSAAPILLEIPDTVDVGRWGSLIITPWLDFSGLDMSSFNGTLAYYTNYISGTGALRIDQTKEVGTTSAYDLISTDAANRGWSPTVSLRGYYS